MYLPRSRNSISTFFTYVKNENETYLLGGNFYQVRFCSAKITFSSLILIRLLYILYLMWAFLAVSMLYTFDAERFNYVQ